MLFFSETGATGAVSPVSPPPFSSFLFCNFAASIFFLVVDFTIISKRGELGAVGRQGRKGSRRKGGEEERRRAGLLLLLSAAAQKLL